MSQDELSRLNLDEDYEKVLGCPDAQRWTLKRADDALEVWATMWSSGCPEEKFQARLLWAEYPQQPPSLKFRDPASGRLDLPSAWPQVRGFRPTSFDACVNWCLEGFGLHPEWKNDLAPDRHRFHDKPVLLTGEPDVLSTANGLDCFLDSLRLLVRVTSHLTISPPISFDDLQNECCRLSETIKFGSGTVVIDSAPNFDQYAAILSIGSRAHADLPWTVINSNGWLARVSSGAVDLSQDCAQPSSLGR